MLEAALHELFRGPIRDWLHSAPGVFACYEAFPMLRAALHEADSWTSRGLVALSTRGVCLLRAVSHVEGCLPRGSFVAQSGTGCIQH